MAAAAASESDEELRFIEDVTSRADEVQAEVLAEILRRDADTEYLRRHVGGDIVDRETFKSRIPIVTYEDLLPDIQRIADGDRSPILCAPAISEFFTSSGTSSGKCKLIPAVEEERKRGQLLHTLLMAVKKRDVPGANTGKGMYFMFVRPGTTTPGGLSASSVLTSLYKSDSFRSRPANVVPMLDFTSPDATILCPDVFQSMYSQLLCGLLHRRHVRCAGASFASTLIRAVRFLQLHWAELVADIAAGVLLGADKVTDPAVRSAVAEIMTGPDPELAECIASECSGGNWAGIIARVWPGTKYIDTVVTGSMAQYVPMLEFYGGGLPVVSSIYASSEGTFGINLRPLCDPCEVSYTLMPNMAYFEFIPQQADTGAETDSGVNIVDLDRVEVGKEYELVVTTYAGLWRYRVGDVLRATGFHNAAPRFEFVRRKNVVLSVDMEKTDEADLQAAVAQVSAMLRPHGASVAEYTSRTDMSAVPGHYVIYLELSSTESPAVPLPEGVMEACCLEMEEAMNAVYRVCRASTVGWIAPLEIRVVRPGTFEEVMDLAVTTVGASFGQYKTPRCVTSSPAAIVELLETRVESAHFSPASLQVGCKWAAGPH